MSNAAWSRPPQSADFVSNEGDEAVSAAYLYASIITFEGATEERGYRHPARVQAPLAVAWSAAACGSGLSYLWNGGFGVRSQAHRNMQMRSRQYLSAGPA